METQTDQASVGAIYYAVGHKFVEEALLSARSVRSAMPQLPLAIFTDEDIPDGCFDKRYSIDPSMSVKAQKISSLKRSPFQKTLYLDTDTYMVGAVPELFEVLDKFDMALAISSLGRLPEGWEDVPPCFPVLNCGVIAFRKCAQVSALLDDWLELHGNSNKRDQPAFRIALYRSDVRWITLANHYNFQFDFPQAVRHEVKILHGRHPGLATVGRRVQPVGEVSCVLPVSYLHRTQILGRKTGGPRVSELLKAAVKRFVLGKEADV